MIIPPIRHTVQVRTHKKRRINKKWRKRYGLKWVEESENKIYAVGTTMFMTQATYDKIKAGINEEAVVWRGEKRL